MPTHPASGRSLVTRRAVVDVVRTAVLGSYGVAGFAANPVQRLLAAAGLAQPGIRLDLRGGIGVHLDLRVAHGLPVAEVARQVDSAVRYAVRRTIEHEVGRLSIRVDGLEVQPGSPPTRPTAPASVAGDVAVHGPDAT